MNERAFRTQAKHETGARAVALVLFVAGWGANHFVSLLPLYRQTLALSAAEASILFGVYALGLVPSLVVGGPLSDRFGRRNVVVPAALTAIAGSTVLAASHATFRGLLVGRFVVGLGSGATFSAASAWLVDRISQSGRGSRASYATTALSAGFGAGPLIAGAIAGFDVAPLVVPYVVQAAIALLALVLTVSVPDRRTVPLGEPTATNPNIDRGRFRGTRVPLGAALAAPWVFAFPSLGMVVLPSLVRGRVGSVAPFFTGLCAASALMTGAIVQRLLGRLRPGPQARLGLSLGALGVLVGGAAAAFGSVAGVLFACPLLGAGHGLTFASGMRTAVRRASPATRGRAVGAFYALSYFGFGAPYAFTALSTRIGQPCTFALSALAALLTVFAQPAERAEATDLAGSVGGGGAAP